MSSRRTDTVQRGSQTEHEVLLVDDVEALRNLYRIVLESGGPFEVVEEAGNGEAAVDLAERIEPDLVLLDLSMPGMGGLEALPKIRERLPDAAIVILSGFLEDRFSDKALDLGADAYLEKGDEPAELVERLSDVLGFRVHGDGTDPEPATPPETTPSDRELHEFAYAASHDLQEPLRTVRSYLDLLAERSGEDLDEESLEMLRYATEGTQRMQEMIDGLLTYSRIETRPGDLERVDLEEVLEDALANLSLAVRESGAEIQHGDLPEALVEPSQITQLLQNLIENAICHHDGDATIQVGASRTEDGVELFVADDGSGIPEDQQQGIFSLFRQGASGTEADGYGLGLAICRRIVDRHGGKIWIESEPGEGTTVHVRLPGPEADGPEGPS